MGFMDKAKALAEKAQEQAKVGQDKLGQMQAKKRSDALLLELGGIAYLQQTSRAPVGSETRVQALVVQLRDFESQHGAITVTSADAQPGATGSFLPGGSGEGAGADGGPVSGSGVATVPGGAGLGGGYSGGIPSSGGIPTSGNDFPSSDGAPLPGGDSPADGHVPSSGSEIPSVLSSSTAAEPAPDGGETSGGLSPAG